MNSEFTYELDHEGKLQLLDVPLCRGGSEIYTTVYRKATDNDVYFNWNVFEPISLKSGTFKTLIERAYLISNFETECSFYEKNSYPKY